MQNVVLLTDFGTRDPYVAAMKGVIASRTDAAIHDLTHDIAPFDVFEAAWFLRAVLPYWREAVFVCVVDPGVGTSRRILAMRHDTNVLLAPDNGLLTFVPVIPSGVEGSGRVARAARPTRPDPSTHASNDMPSMPRPSSAFGTFSPEGRRVSIQELESNSKQKLESRPFSPPGEKVPKADEGAVSYPYHRRLRRSLARDDIFSVENEALFLPNGSTTFHGRDRFAPVAAAIANGLALDELGPRVDRIERLEYAEPTYQADIVRGTIVSIDRFGNLITDIERARIPFEHFRTNTTYAGDGPFLIVGSTGCVEISMAGASAADHLHLKRLDRVELWPKNDESSES